MRTPHGPLTPDIARQMTLDAEPWLSCDDCFHLVDRYIEYALYCGAGFMPAMRAHLIGCSACAEEARTLAVMVAEADGIDPAQALQHFPHG